MHHNHQSPLIKFIFLIIFTISIQVPNTTSNENLDKLERFLPVNENDSISEKQRFQQIMQGSTSTDSRWRDTKHVVEKQDIKKELQKLEYSHIYQPEWPTHQRKIGGVTAVSFDSSGNVVIFHRVDRIWSGLTFNETNYFNEAHLGAISENTVLAYGRNSGEIIYEWGKNLFYIPHGLTIDHEDNAWITDVALHQVFKFGPKGSNNKALLTLGTYMKPGHGLTQFCKPTSVAVLKNGDFFVADGYCNSRIMKFSKNGILLLKWGKNTFHGDAYEFSPMNFFAVPHALTLAPDQGLICVADRENGRVQCFHSNNGTSHSQYHSEIVGDRLFSVAYASVSGGQLYVVNGPVYDPFDSKVVSGFVINMKTQNVISKFAPNELGFSNPHDLAVTMDGNEIYVAELDPNRIHKFVSKNFVNNVSNSITDSVPINVAKPTATIPDELSENVGQDLSIPKLSPPPGSTALLVITLLLIFGLMTFGMVVLISRRRKRGCLIFRTQNRRHAWDFPSGKSDSGFKLGNLLGNERKHRFEKLNQTASDEEQDSSTAILATSAQYA